MEETLRTTLPRALAGLELAITGRLASMRRDEAERRIAEAGASYAPAVSESTSILVVGQGGPPLGDDGRPTKQLARARALQSEGTPIRILPEGEFLGLLGLEDRGTLYTSEQLARILRVPRRQLTAWIRSELIRPIRVVRRLAFFDFRQVAAAEALRALVRAGIRPQRIKKSLEELEGWWPGTDAALAQLESIEEEHGLFVRTADGALADPSGQLVLDFEAAEEREVAREHAGAGEEFWFRHGLALEAEERPEEALIAYTKALESGNPRPELAFNLGNLMFSFDKHEEAAQCFALATEIEPEYVEAWNNLGNALAALGRDEEAVEAFLRALEVDADYPDPHYNLAETLATLGRLDEARACWERYLEMDTHSSWADEVRARLRRTRTS